MAVLSAVVGYALPSVKDEPRRLSPVGYQLLTLVGAGAGARLLRVLRADAGRRRGGRLLPCARRSSRAADLDYRLIPNRVVLAGVRGRARADDGR